MRSEEEIMKLVLDIAISNDAVRAVLLTGSRANPHAIKDKLQDFDVIYIVTNLNNFTKDHSWVDAFGKRIIMQLPDEMTIGQPDAFAFHYLMLLADENRIDLTLFPLAKTDYLLNRESVLKVLLDKDNQFKQLQISNEHRFFIKPPLEKEFMDCCNEFWWVSTYVAKALCRNEIISAKTIMDNHVRIMFLKMVEWYIGAENNFNVSAGNHGRYIHSYLSPTHYNQLLATYPDINIDNIWKALFQMTALFDELSEAVAEAMSFHYNKEEFFNVTQYLKRMYSLKE